MGKVGYNSSVKQYPASSVSPTFSELADGYFPGTWMFN